MASLGRDDRWITDALGVALSGAQVFWLTQPADTSAFPPTPLAPLFTDLTGVTTLPNPQITDGFGHAFAYMNNAILYTIYVSHPLFGPFPVILLDQGISGGGGGGGGGGNSFAEVPSGLVDGTNTLFTLTVTPTSAIVWDNFPLIQGVGYTIAGNTITFTTAPRIGDSVFAQGFF